MRLACVVLIAMLPAVASCQTAEDAPAPTDSPTPNVVGKGPRSVPPSLSPTPRLATGSPAALDLLSTLSGKLKERVLNDINIRIGVTPEEIVNVRIEEKQWFDSCLDLAEHGTCTYSGAPPTGQIVQIEARGDTFIYHTAGENYFPFAGVPDSLERVVATARLIMQEDQGADPESIELQFAERVIWDSACLGFTSDEPCGAPVGPTAGYRITLLWNGQSYVFHTNLWGAAFYAPSESN